MLYTGKGDDGTTSVFGKCDQRVSKSSAIAEALGSLDEVNSFLGIVKVRADVSGLVLRDIPYVKVLHAVQQNLFAIQAEIAGANKHIAKEKVLEVEAMVSKIEIELPPIKTFFISGGTELAALLDTARTFARRAERRVVGVHEEGNVSVGNPTLAYLNRLSSLLYAMARQVNHKSGITEEPPSYR